MESAFGRIVAELVISTSAAAKPVTVALLAAYIVTYLLHLQRNCPRPWAREALFLFPLQHGRRHAVFLVCGWGLWSASVAMMLPILASMWASGTGQWPFGRRASLPLSHLDAASGAAVVSSLWGELFLLKGLLVFERRDNSPDAGKAGHLGPRRHATRHHTHASEHPATQQQVLAPRLSSLLVCLMGGALALTGGLLLLAAEHMPDTPSRVLYCLLALSCVFIGASSTHGLGGHLRHCAGAATSAGAAMLRASSGGGASEGGGGGGGGGAGGGGEAGHGSCKAGSHQTNGTSSASREDAALSRGSGGDGGPRAPAGAQPARAPAEPNAGPASGPGAGPGPNAAAVGPDEVAADEAAVEPGPSWRFFQPFQGGSVFVATQAIGWTLFSATVVAVLLLARQLVAGVGYCLRRWALAAGLLMMATQLTLGVSILTFQHRRSAQRLLLPVIVHPRAALGRAAGLVIPVVMMYLPLHVFFSCVAAVFVLLPPARAVQAVVAFLLPYYAITLRGNPAHTGGRRWEGLCTWFSANVESSLAWWAGALVVVRDFEGTAEQAADEAEALQQAEAETALRAETEAEPGGRSVGEAERPRPGTGNGSGSGSGGSVPSTRRRFVLGFHPHGLFPTGAGFVPLMPSVRAAFPGTTIVTLTASIVHHAPFLRDIAGWAGFRQVTRATFRRALHDTGAVLLCPGGQAELVYADRAFPERGSQAAAPVTLGPLGPAPAGEREGKEQGREWEESRRPDGGDGEGTAEKQEGVPGLQPTPPVVRPVAQPAVRHQVVVYGGHQGFVRLALEEGAWLVPVLALGETLQLRNIVSAPSLQRASYKRIGFPVPFLLAGRWAVTTLPLRNPLIYVLGRPLPPPRGWESQRQRVLSAATSGSGSGSAAGSGSGAAAEAAGAGEGGAGCRQRKHAGRGRQHSRHGPSPSGPSSSSSGPSSASSGPSATAASIIVPQAVVDEYHARFYAAVRDLWARHAHLHPVLRHAELVFEWGRHAPAQHDVAQHG